MLLQKVTMSNHSLRSTDGDMIVAGSRQEHSSSKPGWQHAGVRYASPHPSHVASGAGPHIPGPWTSSRSCVSHQSNTYPVVITSFPLLLAACA